MIVDQDLFDTLPPKSNKYITCRCDQCGGEKWIRKYAITKRGLWDICKPCFLRQRLEYTPIRRRTIRKTYSKDDTFFTTPVPLNSYWAGFIAADGCVCYGERNRASLQIALHPQDRFHIQQFMKDSTYSGILKDAVYGKIQKSYVTICSAHRWLNSLNTNWNITPKKTYDLRSPNDQGFENNLAYIAGYIDGDGCFYSRKQGSTIIKIVGTAALLDWIKQQVDILTGIPSGRVYKCKWANAYQYFIGKQESVKKLVAEIRKLDLPLMERKWSKVEVSM